MRRGRNWERQNRDSKGVKSWKGVLWTFLKGRKVPICDWKREHLSTPTMISFVATFLTTRSCYPCTHLLTSLGVWFFARHNYNISGNVQTNSISPPSEIQLLLSFTCYWQVPYKSNGYLISVHLWTNFRHYPLLNENTNGISIISTLFGPPQWGFSRLLFQFWTWVYHSRNKKSVLSS